MTSIGSKKPQKPLLIFAALILNIFICGWYIVPMAIDIVGSHASYEPASMGPLTVSPIFLDSFYLLWPMGAVICSALGLFKSGKIRIFGIAFGLSFSLFMSALIVHHYADSLEYDPNRMGGIIEFALVWVSLFAVNIFAAMRLFKHRRQMS